MTAPDSHSYLTSLITDPTSQGWGSLYTPTQAELPLQVQTVGMLRSETQTQLQPEKAPERLDVLVGLRQYAPNHVVLVGKPGFGKSTTLRRLLWETAQTTLAAIENGETDYQIPVLIELRNCRNGSVLDWIQQSSRRLRLSQEAIEDGLLAGRFFLLFDGINELPTAESWSTLNQFRNDADFRSNPMIFTTRQLEAGAELGVEKKLEMLPLTKPQIQEFVRKRLGENASALLQQFQGRLWELAETPLLLQMLGQVFAQSPSGQLPNNRGELFQQFSQQYDRFKPLRGLVSEDSRRLIPILLEQFAFEMMQGRSPTEMDLQITRADAIRKLQAFLHSQGETDALTKATEYLEDLLEWHLLQFTADQQKIEFHHQLFQEYYAAEALLKQLPQLTDQQLQHDYLNYLKWTEAIALMMGLSEMGDEQAAEIVNLALKEVDLMLGARLANEIKPHLRDQFVELIETSSLPTVLKTRLLGEINTPQSSQKLVQNLYNQDTSICENAAFALGNLQDLTAIRKLIEQFTNETPYVVDQAIIALANIGEPAIPELGLSLSSQNPRIRRSVIRTLSNISIESLMPIFSETLLSDTDYEVCEAAAFALAKIGDENSLSTLFNVLKHKDVVRRCACASSLLIYTTELAIPSLLKAASQDESAQVRYFAVTALGKFKESKVVNQLNQCLIQETDTEVSNRIIEILGDIGNSESEEILCSWLSHFTSSHLITDCTIANQLQCIISSLDRLGNKSFYPDLIKILKNNQVISQVIETVISALSNMGCREVIPLLMDAVESKFSSIRGSAAVALAKIDRSLGVPILFEFVSKDTAWYSRVKAAEALISFGEQAVISLLINLLKDDDQDVRIEAARILGEAGDTTALHALHEVLIDDRTRSSQVMSLRWTAVLALEKIADSSSLPVLSKLLLEVSDRNIDLLFRVILSIQKQYRFYNYDIAKLIIEESREAGVKNQDKSPNIYFIGSVGNLNTGSVTNQNQIGVQHVSATSDATKIANQNSH